CFSLSVPFFFPFLICVIREIYGEIKIVLLSPVCEIRGEKLVSDFEFRASNFGRPAVRLDVFIPLLFPIPKNPCPEGWFSRK
ncbi:MAG: hypothetical protein WHS88_06360, partial [Anaerohalosphaeraceae bacterium]